MADELAARRKESRPNGVSMTEEESHTVTKTGVMPLWMWFSAQAAHSIPGRAEAAKHVRDRYNLAYVRFSKIDRDLAKEDSEHLIGFRELLDEYRALFNIADEDDNFARQTGVGGKMLPFAPEICDSCKRDAVPGTGKCARHGGQWISEKDLADISRRLSQKIMVMSESALRVLEDLMDNGRSEQVRAQAAMSVLDRSGMGAHVNVNHTGQINITSSDEANAAIRERLITLAINVQKRAELEASLSTPVQNLGITPEHEIIDAEVVG